MKTKWAWNFLTVLALLATLMGVNVAPVHAEDPSVGTISVLDDSTRPPLLEQLPNQMGLWPSDSAGCDILGVCAIAQDFAVPTGEAVTIDQIELWGFYFALSDPGPGASDYTDSFTVAFHPDVSGLPGPATYTKTAVSALREPTGQLLQGLDEYHIALTLAEPLRLEAGTYWVEIFNTNANSSTAGSIIFGWEYGNRDTLGMGLNHVASRDAQGLWELGNQGGPGYFALRLLGTRTPVLAVSPDTLPLGTERVAYSQQFSAVGGSGSYTFSLTGTLPDGMSLTGDTLSGTPTEKGAFPITVKAVDAADPTVEGQREYTLTIGMLDLSFGTNGRVITHVQRTHHVAPNSALQPDGKIVVLGNIGFSDGVQLERYNQDGTLDTQFGTNGLVTTLPGDIGGATGVDSLTVAIAPDGHILVSASVFEATTSSTYFALIRYNADGSLDTGFGEGGFLTLNTPTLPADYSRVDWAEVIGVDYQQDGKIVVAATLLPEMNPDPKQGLLMRFHEAAGTWTLDPSFGTDGIATFLETGTNTIFRGLDILATGEIVVGVDFRTYPDYGSSVLRYSADGVLVQEYANRAGGDVSFVRGLPDGTVYALGAIGNPAAALLVRYLPTGEVDTSGFGTDGEVVTKFSADRAVCSSMLVQPDGKPVLACYYAFEAPSYHSFFAVARFNTDGTPDDSFFPGGVFATPFDDPGDPTTVHGAQSVYLTAEGKLLATGYIGLDEEGDLAVLAQYAIEVAVGPDMIADGTVGMPYTQTFTAAGGIALYTFSVVGGSLPAGLTLGSDGLLSGTPTEEGSFPVTIQAAGSGGPQGSKAYILTIKPSADLSLTKTDSKDPVKPGAQLVYTLTVKNLGPNAAQSLTLVDTLDRNTKYGSVAAPKGWSCRYANYAVTCTSTSLASGSSAVIKITVTVNKTARVGKDLVNNATVSSATYDPMTTNNSVVQKTMVAK